MSEEIKMAVIGLGNFGALHARTLAGLPQARLVGLVDQRVDHAEKMAGQLGVSHSSGSLEALCKQTEVDAVVIATRTDTHVQIALQAIEAGLHVLLEKPAGSPHEIQNMIQRILPDGPVVMVNHICLFHSLIAPLVARVRNAGFRSAHFVRHRPAATGAHFSEENPIQVLMVHDFYVAAQMAGGEEPTNWHVETSRGPRGKIDMTWVTLRWADGRVATFHSHWILPESAPSDGWDEVEVFGADYYTKAKTNPAPWQWFGADLSWPVALEISENSGRPMGMLAEAQRAFLSACHNEPIPHGCRLEDALQAARWIERLCPA